MLQALHPDAGVVSTSYFAKKSCHTHNNLSNDNLIFLCVYIAPYGDVDDRVRAIAHQMGLTTVLWDYDSEDWKLPSSAGNGMIKPEVVDGYFTKWIEKRKSGNDTEHGHITLQHEINEATVGIAEKWLPRIQGVFDVKPLNECTSMKQLYWEQEIEDEKDEKDYDHDDGHDDDHDHDDDDHHRDDDDHDDDDGDDDYE